MPANEAMVQTNEIRAGLVGRGIARSRTPAMHMAEGRAQGFDYAYEIIDMDQHGGSLADVIDDAGQQGFAGLNITYPFKVDIVALLDDLSDNARALGAVNTVVFRNGKRFGHNTDLWGFSESFRLGMTDAPKNEGLLIGAGGAGMAVGHALLLLGVGKLWVFDTDRVRAEALTTALMMRFGNHRVAITNQIEQVHAGLDGVVNATPVGMDKLPGCPFPKNLLRHNLWVADIIYFPLDTELITAARKAGCRVLTGDGMAVFQAVRAFALFTGMAPDPNRMRHAFEALGQDSPS